MTRRIATAILLTVWATLIAGGLVAYLTTRAALVADLDHTLLARASSLPEIVRPAGMPSNSGRDEQDRYVVRNDVGQTVARPQFSETGNSRELEPKLIDATFSRLADGTRVRSVTIRAMAKPTSPEGSPTPVTIVYSGTAERFDSLLNRLAAALIVFGVIGGLATAYLASKVSRAALRPLAATAEVIGSIDEQKLDRRIDGTALPPELAPMADRLNELLARLEQAFAQRRQFLADASHELRTPIAALLTSLEVTLRRPRDAKYYHEALETCLTDARMLRRLIETLLQQVRSETLNHDEPAQPVDISVLLDECATVAGALGAPQEIQLVRSYAAGIRVTSQPNRLRTIAMNLMANAVDHNRAGGTVELSCTCESGELLLTVRDTGPGIDPEHLPHVFEPFYRADKARGRETGHLGLGLFLVQSHVQALGGRCEVESKVDQGTCFSVRLPADRVSEDEAQSNADNGVIVDSGPGKVGHAA